jgi:hypothetical protein
MFAFLQRRRNPRAMSGAIAKMNGACSLPRARRFGKVSCGRPGADL